VVLMEQRVHQLACRIENLVKLSPWQKPASFNLYARKCGPEGVVSGRAH
jgi:hypothetical protein